MKDSLYAMILHRVNHSDSLYGLYSSIGFFLSNSYLLSNNQTSLQEMKSKEAQQKRINVILLTGLMAIFVVFPVIVLCVFFVYIFFRHLNNVAIGNSQRQKKQVINRKRLELDFFLQEMMRSKNKGVLIRKDLATTRKDSLVYATFLMSGTFYALTLQEFLYPNLEEIQEHYPNIFFISRPKEVVSSDLVFAKIYNNQLFLILSYCPFHGVAGASLIFVQYMILNKLVIELNLTDEQSIVKLFLSDLYDLLFNPSTQSPIELYRPDLAFFSHILHSSEVSYVGLNMNLYELKHSHAENGQCQIHEATVFGGDFQNDVEIKLHSIDLTVPSLFYMTTRGVYSQKNVDDEEFTENMFVDTLCTLLSFPLLEQPPLLMNEFFAFRGGREQDDDLTLVGLQIE